MIIFVRAKYVAGLSPFALFPIYYQRPNTEQPQLWNLLHTLAKKYINYGF